MSFFTANHDEAKNKFEPIKPGKYEVVVTEAKPDVAKSSGNPVIKVTYTVRTDVDQLFQKRKVFDNFTATPAAMFKFQQMAKAMGLPDGQGVDSIEAFANLMVYKAVKITVTNKKETYQGEEKIKENVAFIDVPGVPYSGGSGGPSANPFDAPEGEEGGFSFGPPPSDEDVDYEGPELDENPPWEKSE